MTFLHVDSIWTHRNAVRGDFGKIIGKLRMFNITRTCYFAVLIFRMLSGEAKTLVSNVIKRNPRNMFEFRSVAEDEGMLVIDK